VGRKSKLIKTEVLDDIVKMLEKKYGTLFKEGEVERVHFSTGSKILDSKIGGGVPSGCLVEFYGESLCGKTTMAMKTIANAQKMGKLCIYVDAENRYNEKWVSKLGVDTDKLKVITDCNGERVANKVSALISSGEVGLIVIDSIGALVPTVETENGMEKFQMGVQARLCNKMIRILLATNHPNKPATILFINHFYMKIGVIYGNPKETKGGKNLKNYTAVRIEFRKGAWIEEEKEKVGHEIRCYIIKNDFGIPQQLAEFNFNFKEGKIDNLDELRRLGLLKGVLTTAGPFIKYGDKNYKGKEAFYTWLKDNIKEFEGELND